ncbi:hypothetical protein PENTCL1PPCAC_10990 [Pristionchus entomophagus]|uniref:C2H2-type domain-containing protein n=1 Tax=Pristionchus entomophagus TaxID=358040 RepID=A0AAV5T8Z9_9BILA|nr:hypothetical protein PENTCL1PPCAC_10990 [Pristionchus entomophagus]
MNSDEEDDKSHIRSAIDALGDALPRTPKRRGRPRKHPNATISSNSSAKRSSSRVSVSNSEAEEHEEEEVVESRRKRRKRGSDDEEWNEEVETLTVSERRTRKKPTLYSEESVASEERRRQMSRASRGRGGSRGRPSYSSGPIRTVMATYNRPALPNFSQKEKDALDKMRQQWQDIENPLRAKQRIFPYLRRGQFEPSLELITPVPDLAQSLVKGTIPDGIKTIFGQFSCSAGFLVFVNSVRMEACLAFYDIADKLFVLSDLADNLKIAQALRFWWNSLSFATRRKWEQFARKMVDDAGIKDACAGGSEVPLGKLSDERIREEKRWEHLHSQSLAVLDEVDTVVTCPLCEKDENAETCRMSSIREIQDHFFHHHWQVHGYACQFCGTMFSTADDLMSGHSDCPEWVSWNASRILRGTQTEKLGMSCCRMLLCCSECGWHTSLSRKGRKISEGGTIHYLKTFFDHHNNDGLLTMIIYFPAPPTEGVESVRFPVTSVVGGDPTAPCAHCGPSVTFRDPAEANEHYIKEHRDKALVCEICKAQTTTEYLLKQHQMAHVHDNSFFADYLSNSARVFPPPSNLSSAARCGWKHRADTDVVAFGGVPGGIGVHDGYDLVSPDENMRQAKARLTKKRRMDGKPACDGGYEYAEIQEESAMARKVREKLRSKYSEYEGMGGFDEPVWLKDEDAIKFKEWMDFWESKEGKALGGPPRSIEIDMTSCALRIPSVDVELQFNDMDVISGFLLNEDVFYCLECDTIVKGKQAEEHLKPRGTVASKCAVTEKGIEEVPHLNENMFLLHLDSTFPAYSALPCPHCSRSVCSITGLRVHIMETHGRFVKCQKVKDENVTNAISLKFDIRSRLAKTMDAMLGMLPSGMLTQRKPLVTDLNALSEHTWSHILTTRENTDPQFLASIKKLVEEDKMLKAVPRTSPAGYSIRGRPQPMQQYPRYPVAVQVPARLTPSYEHSVQVQDRRPVQQRPMSNGMSSLGRPPQMQRGLVQHQFSPNVARMNGGAIVPIMPRSARKVAKMVHAEGGKTIITCGVCDHRGVQYERSIFEAHMVRCHYHTCGHCTAIFVYEKEAKDHARKCRAGLHPQLFHPDPRLPHIKAQCGFCNGTQPMIEMAMHLMTSHMSQLEFDEHGRLNTKMQMVGASLAPGAKEPEVERLRYKYYVPSDVIAQAQGFKACNVCGLCFPDQSKLLIHLRCHHEFLYFCWLCPRAQSASLGTVNAIVQHIRAHHLPADNQKTRNAYMPCPLCRTNMITRPLQHLMYECDHNYVCQLCRDLPFFESVRELHEHREKCHFHTLRRFECSQCHAYFSTTADFTRHLCDQEKMECTCSCGLKCPTRREFLGHFMSLHANGNVCKICCIRFTNSAELRKHLEEHGKTSPPSDIRHMLLCSYGDQNVEQKTLYTLVSNISCRLRRKQTLVGVGTPGSPVQLSDDDDDVIELDSTAVQKERRQAAIAAARVSQQPPAAANGGDNGETSEMEIVQSDDEVIKQVMKTIVDQISKAEDGDERVSQERNAREEREMSIIIDDDDDVVMMEDVGNMSARVRVEAEDSTVGGQNEPGYKEDDEDMEKEGEEGTPNQPVIREFTPDGDDDLCVVAEVENSGCSTAQATINKQREKKFGCPKCSDKFMTSATLNDHLKTAHQFDAGSTTIMEELGIPLSTALWICTSCCLAFPTPEHKKAHANQHGQPSFACETCSGCAYNREVMSHHHRRVQDRKVAYGCGECMVEYDHETNLHEHNAIKHNVTLFYFCKACEMGSTDSLHMYKHFMMECNSGYLKRRNQDDASKCIGVCPASQLHYQPLSLTNYKQVFAQNPRKFVAPSLCNHRSLIVASDKQIACNQCRCLESIQRHSAMQNAEGRKFEPTQLRHVRSALPLSAARGSYDVWLRVEREKRQRELYHNQMNRSSRPNAHVPPSRTFVDNTRKVTVTPGDGGRVPASIIRGQPSPVYHGAYTYNNTQHQEAQQRHTDRLQALQLARTNGGVRLLDGMPRLPVQQSSHRAHFPVATVPRSTHYSTSSFHPSSSSRQPLSTMGSLQSLAAVAGRGSTGPSSSVSTPSPLSQQCTHCSSIISSEREIFLHKLHTRGAFVCDCCTVGLKDERAAIQHMMNHLDPAHRSLEYDIHCPIANCAAEVSTVMALKDHLSMDHNPPLTHQVENCELSFGSAAPMKAHEEAHQKSETKNGECCLLCGTLDNWEMQATDSRGKALTISHFHKHAFKHKYYCKICMDSFTEENQMITHFILWHTKDEGGTSRSCNDCSISMRTDYEQQAHCIAQHTITELCVPENGRVVVSIPPTLGEFLGLSEDNN